MGSSSDQAIVWGPRVQDWKDHFEPQFGGLWNAMLDLAEPLAGKKFLDAGCGAGGASLLAKERGAKIFGVDATPEFIDICKSRNPDGEYSVGDLEAMPYADNSFDVIIATNSLQFTYDPAQALSEFKRILKPDGVAVVAIFTAIERNDMGTLLRAFAALLTEKPRVGPFALSAAGLLDNAIRASQLQIDVDNEIFLSWNYGSPEEFWRIQTSRDTVRELIAKVGEEPVRTAALTAIQPMTDSQGKIILKNSWRVVRLTK